ncbi:hypothetical protein YPPY66_1759 [Yersinia pestis PY-66]|uniref:Uncharacterized protein n=3 Tax=Yersinia pseudotuberculosis complex TaxID=1649845 RepID=A0A0U1QZM0_YERP3|nr:hypothetical protein YpsIP31758_2658 [Yersinia pseudotuberculosis IP 31758]ADV99400.1 hypothetical protein YPC_2869 [Yersinia pestis biovar Medievalis str. Harbin 35]EDR34496.1 hypothetical protein YPIP275_4723 [Yersinia pestis biovar Orientalis str. IP275]EDR43432.1 hypothetical protein YpE1979001_2579 [Yersinia pestis biovar Antiqua str. E1979001]EDR51525.1 hypothetical protein YpB42003004_2344 [Yersinia pestis biovar Antiqua str. B42003004]EDR66663.1 hypothetical protein YpK1973002_1204 
MFHCIFAISFPAFYITSMFLSKQTHGSLVRCSAEWVSARHLPQYQ